MNFRGKHTKELEERNKNIYKLYSRGYKPKYIAIRFGLSRSSINRILHIEKHV